MSINKEELEIISFWEKNKVFELSVKNRPKEKLYSFYDGPPFATGLPHYGHLVAGLMKDAVPRYFTMKGFRVERKWGWDCHGLPVENIIESDLNLKSKKDIEAFGIKKFNDACRSSVLKYADEWKKTVRRMGRFVDMENDYKTMDKEFMESVWWVFSELHKKELIYEGKKPMHICPRCVTPLSNFEVTQGYMEVKDISVTAKFKLKKKIDDKEVHILAWTTTPWTLPGNTLIAINKNIIYVLAKKEEDFVILAKETITDEEIIRELKSEELLNQEYEPLFPYFKNNKNSFKIIQADFVTTEDGTGVVHIAPAFGEDDYNLGRAHEVEWIQHVNMDGTFTEEVVDFKGLEVKPKDDPLKTDIEIIKYLHHNNKLYKKQKYTHTYPHCWRCDTPLLNYATSSWFVEVTKIKDNLLKNNQKINWVPSHMKEGRFGKWLEGAKDWAISRNRFWGTPLPIWKSEDGEIICVSSAKELEELSGKKIDDLHKHVLDEIVIEKNNKKYYKIPEVLDCWFESGSMPYAQHNYPFSNKEKLENSFPAEFIAEGQDQTRGWFYTLHVLSTALTLDGKSILNKTHLPAFKNVIVNGIVLAEDGKKMSKRLKNYPDPNYILEKYGADALRYYLITSPVMSAKNLNFSEEGVREVYSKLVNTLKNSLSFYEMFKVSQAKSTDNPLDKWILSKLSNLNKEVEENMQKYLLAEATRPILDFTLDLSQWYIRRSRDRFKEDNEDAKKASYTLRKVLLELSKIIAPFTPFIAEKLYQSTGAEKTSVHLEDYPSLNLENNKLEKDMDEVRLVVSKILDLREKERMPVRQPLRKVEISGYSINPGLIYLIKEETNIKEVLLKDSSNQEIVLDTKLDDELKKEGILRDLIRKINSMRKKLNLTVDHRINIYLKSDHNLIIDAISEYGDELKENVQADDIIIEESHNEILIQGLEVDLDIKVKN